MPRWMLREQWTLGLVDQSAEDIVRRGLVNPVRWLPPRLGGFIADPWGTVLPDGRLHIVAEVLDYRTFKGVLAAASVSFDDFERAEFKPVVEAPGHLSFPQPVRWGDGWLLFCESWEAQGILVYRGPSVQGPWRLADRLLPGIPVVDPTPVEHAGRWYLFYTRRDDGPNSRLRLMHADGPLGPWRPHVDDVVAEGLAEARPAGPPFRLSDGRLVRPVQDCRQTYGGAIELFQVDVLAPESFRQTPVRRLEPPAGEWCWGLHTLCAVGPTHSLVDGKRWLVAPLEPLRALARVPLLRRRRQRAAGIGTEVPVSSAGA